MADDKFKSRNIILDFMDPENRILYGTYANYDATDHERILSQALNVAVLLCDEYCILPPCAIMQCRVARNTLIGKSSFFDSALIKFPVRERTLKAFFDKKKLNYEKDRLDDDYAEFFSEDGPKFLIEHATEIIKRETKIGEAVAEMVSALGCDDPLLAGLKKKYDDEMINEIKRAPAELIKNGEAISVKAIKRLLNLDCDEDIDFQIGRILQNKYFYIYIYEYDAQIIYDIPPKTTDFLMTHADTAFEYSYIRHVFTLLGLFDTILNAKSDDIINMRQLASYYDFMESLIGIGRSSKTLDAAKKTASKIIETCRRDLKISFFKITEINMEPAGEKDNILEVISQRFSAFAMGYRKHCNETDEGKHEVNASATVAANSGYISKLKLKLAACDINKPYVFIGYNRNDLERQVYEDCIYLGQMGVNYWIDNANMYGCDANSEGWKTVVQTAIEKCSIYIPYISPSFFNSAPCCEEVRNFFKLNSEAAILILIQNGYTIDAIIRKILTYDNILQGDEAQNMIRLFKASPGSDGTSRKYIIDQPYRVCHQTSFLHYINDSIFYNTFAKQNVINAELYNDFECWCGKGNYLLNNLSLDRP